jgi:hypothetical protein
MIEKLSHNMKTNPSSIDSTQFKLLLSRLDSISEKLTIQLPDTFSVHSVDKIREVPVRDVEIWHTSWWMEVILAPLLIGVFVVLITWIFTRFSDKRKEYNRLTNLYSFVDMWLTHVTQGINDQILIFENIIKALSNIDNPEPPNFSFAVLDIDRVLQIKNEDLYKIFVTIRRGNQNEQEQNFYKLISSLLTIKGNIEEYKNTIPEAQKRLKQESDEAYSIIRKLYVNEAQTLGLLSAIKKELHTRKMSAIETMTLGREMKTLESFIQNLEDLKKEMYLALTADKKNKTSKTKKIIYYYSRKKLKLFTRQMSHPSINVQLIESATDVNEAIKHLASLNRNVIEASRKKIKELEHSRDLIVANQQYFNRLPMLSILQWNE